MVTTIDIDAARRAVAAVTDPEIPSLTIEDMGILRRVEPTIGGVRVTITPTYSGCPAMTQIEEDIRAALETVDAGLVEIETVFSPAWTTDWMSESARAKLEAEAIAPPSTPSAARCPRCGAESPTMLSEFGTTACKALMVCAGCGEAFDLFKELT
jgi:ring-1,2-phenylacetyl-CoA epoxidase subunit PaaD